MARGGRSENATGKYIKAHNQEKRSTKKTRKKFEEKCIGMGE